MTSGTRVPSYGVRTLHQAPEMDDAGPGDASATAAAPSLAATSPSLALVLLGYVGAVILAGITRAATTALTLDDNGPWAILGGQAGLWAGFLGVVLLAQSRPGAPRYVGTIRTELGRSDALGLAVGVAAQLVLVPLLYLPFRRWIDEDELSAPAEELLAGFNGITLVLMGIGVMLIAPVVEELFFRGLLLRTIQERWGTVAAVIGSSVFFGATHLQLLQFAGLTAAGLLFALARVRSGRLGSAIAVHVGFNLTTFVALIVV